MKKFIEESQKVIEPGENKRKRGHIEKKKKNLTAVGKKKGKKKCIVKGG